MDDGRAGAIFQGILQVSFSAFSALTFFLSGKLLNSKSGLRITLPLVILVIGWWWWSEIGHANLVCRAVQVLCACVLVRFSTLLSLILWCHPFFWCLVTSAGRWCCCSPSSVSSVCQWSVNSLSPLSVLVILAIKQRHQAAATHFAACVLFCCFGCSLPGCVSQCPVFSSDRHIIQSSPANSPFCTPLLLLCLSATVDNFACNHSVHCGSSAAVFISRSAMALK